MKRVKLMLILLMMSVGGLCEYIGPDSATMPYIGPFSKSRKVERMDKLIVGGDLNVIMDGKQITSLTVYFDNSKWDISISSGILTVKTREVK